MCAHLPPKIASDVGTLNYALTLENLEAAYYKTGLQNFTEADFLAAGTSTPTHHTYTSTTADHAKSIHHPSPHRAAVVVR